MNQDIRSITVKPELPTLNTHSLRRDGSFSLPLPTGTSPVKREAEPSPDYERGNPKRRKRDNQAVHKVEIDAYEHLFAKEVESYLGDDAEDAAYLRAAGNSKGAGYTQYGAVQWTPEEKAKLFHHLDRRGRHDLHAISDAIGTKTEPEVADYLHLLRTAYDERHMRAERLMLHRYEDLPAAVEVGESLGALLEEAAASSRDAEYKLSVKREAQKYKERAIVHQDHAAEIYRQIEAEVDTSALERGTLDFANSILNVPRMLELSAYVFMNSKNEDDNWMHIAPADEVPAMLATCLIDLCNLVVSVTERIVSSANFLAMSRIRAVDSRSYRNGERLITRADVLAAVDILNMPPNPWEFWARCPRKCQLRVVLDDDGKTSESEQELSYNTVEKTLLQSGGRNPRLASSSPEPDDVNLTFQTKKPSISPASLAYETSKLELRSHTGSRKGSHSSSQASSRVSFALGSRTSGRSRSRSRGISIARSGSSGRSMDIDDDGDSDSSSDLSEDESGQLELVDDEIAEASDLRAGKVEEDKWRQALNVPPDEEDMHLDDNGATASFRRGRSQSTVRHRKSAQDLDDWTKWCAYQAKWECYPSPLPLDTGNAVSRELDWQEDLGKPSSNESVDDNDHE